MSERLGVELWIKRDDLTGFAFGGNKGRKLEYLLADAISHGAEVLVSCGSTQSNFIRHLGAACSMHRLACAAVVMDLPYETARPVGKALRNEGGNVFLDRLLGVDLRHHPDGHWDDLYALAEELAMDFEAMGKRVYRVPVGGFAPLGAFAFVEAARELLSQAGPFDYLVTASSGGSTQTGLAYALQGTRTKVVGIACDPEPEMPHEFERLSHELHEIAQGNGAVKAADYDFRLGYVGPGYGIPSEEGMAAIELLAKSEGIFLDPIYSGKAFAGLMDLVERRELAGRIVFWHTGGLPALFAI